MEFDDYFLNPTKTHHHPIGDPTSFPTILPDPAIYHYVGKNGHRMLWTVFALMFLIFLGASTLSFIIKDTSKRLVHSLTTVILLVSGLCYLAMATGNGYVWTHYRVKEEHDHGLPDTYRHIHHQSFWVPYIQWLVAAPLVIVDLGLLAGLPGASIFSAVVANYVTVASGLVASVTRSSSTKWTWYTIGVLGYLWVVYTLALGARSARAARHETVHKSYSSIMSYTVIVWFAYHIVWMFAANHRLSVDGEIIALGVLDILSLGVFSAWILLQLMQKENSDAVTVEGFWAKGLNPPVAL